MKLIKCDNLRVEPFRLYGGATGPKIGVWYAGSLYMLKTQQILKRRDLRNVEISYANDPISEYIGSHIYEICCIPVHETLLGDYHGKICVLCRDDAYPDRVIEFREWRNSIMDESVSQDYSGMSTKINDIMEVINKARISDKYDVIQRFWDMFVVDALIGNTDRNNGNWGFKIYRKGELDLYRVYDCGGCLNNKKSDDQLSEYLKSGAYENYAYNFTTSIKDENGKRINPLHYIRDNMNPFIAISLTKIPYSAEDVYHMIDGIKPIISNTRAEWYKTMIGMRIKFLNDCRTKATPMDKFLVATSKM